MMKEIKEKYNLNTGLEELLKQYDRRIRDLEYALDLLINNYNDLDKVYAHKAV